MQDLHEKRLAFIGGGNMGRAIIAGLVGNGFPGARIAVADPQPATLSELAGTYGVTTTHDNAAALTDADLVVLAVKPQQMADVVAPLRRTLAAGRPLVLSVAAGIRAADLARWTGPGIPVVRSMPNRPALLGAGATALYAEDNVDASARELAEAVLKVTGHTTWVRTEAELDWVTALSGSGPAYFFLLAELLARCAVAHGLDAATAAQLAAHTLHGAGRMAVLPAADLATLRAEVTSKGGTTAAALASFEADDLADVVQRAMSAAARRSEELGDQFGTG